jgi:hypothetical protein
MKKPQTSLIPQNINLTDEEEQTLDRIWEEIAAEDAQAAPGKPRIRKADDNRGADGQDTQKR